MHTLGPDGRLGAWVERVGGGRLVSSGVQGSLRDGGTVASLRWQPTDPQSPALQAEGLSLHWNWRALWQRHLEVTQLQAHRVTLNIPPSPGPAKPPASLQLPLALAVHFQLEQLALSGTLQTEARQVKGDYSYLVAQGDGGPSHRLNLQSLALAQGRYSVQAQLQADAPQALELMLQGQLHSAVPGGAAVQAGVQASLRGNLGSLPDGRAAALELLAQVSPQAGDGAQPQLDARVYLAPWAPQPVQRGNARLLHIDLAQFWPSAPHTALQGEIAVQPESKAWSARARLRNLRPGPWDHQQLPLQALDAQVTQQASSWQIDSLHARIGDAMLDGNGHWQAEVSPPAWQGKLQFHALNPAALWSTASAARLDGQLTAEAQPDGTAFDLRLHPGPGANAAPAELKGLALGELRANGIWQADRVRLHALSLDAAQAQLQAQGDWLLRHAGFAGNATLQFPGGHADFKGQLTLPKEMPQNPLSVLAAPSSLNLALDDAARSGAWVQSLRPVLPDAQLLANWQLAGRATLALDWQGEARPLAARLALPQFSVQDLRPHDGERAPPLQFSALQLSAEGLPATLALRLDGAAQRGPWRASLSSRGRASLASSGAGSLVLDPLALRLQDATQVWTLQPDAALQLRWTPNDVELLPSSLALNRAAVMPANEKPAPALAPLQLAWTQLLWDHEGLHSSGRLSAFTLEWLTALLGPRAQTLDTGGLSGQMSFDGDWSLLWPRSASTPVRLQAGLQRRSGDLRLTLDSSETVAAGLREASLRLSANTAADGAMALQARLRWDSERAGQVDANVATQLRATRQGWDWAEDAPLSGQLNAQLPQLGVWSLLAPPGWRMRGTAQACGLCCHRRCCRCWRTGR